MILIMDGHMATLSVPDHREVAKGTLPSLIRFSGLRLVGLPNSHDQSYPAGLVAGTSVLVCDNRAFAGEVKISRKHTRFALRRGEVLHGLFDAVVALS